MKVYINGTICDGPDARISVLDHGLLYGDGVFEGIRFYRNRVFKLVEHIDRLYESAQSIVLAMPMTKAEMIDAVVRTVAAHGKADGYIRLIVTRGVGKLGLNPYNCSEPQVIIIVDSIMLYAPELYERGMEIITIATRRNVPEAVNPRIKSLNYLNNVLAKIEALNAGYEEALMLNADGFVAEATGDNVFIVKGGVLKTPSVECGILAGITRGAVIGLARERGIEVVETALTRHDLYTADECFLTGTAAEVIPVIKVDGRTIGSGDPGPIALELIKGFHKLTDVDGVEVRPTGAQERLCR
ncbi:MAG: branched-chain-amino-acid transaminase [Verrucomicrobia bacterium]|nr:branched-chain-amino-acid transaminase [Verrucomicrobiota bacterium]